jgi:cysteinyl-tRNA synthetase
VLELADERRRARKDGNFKRADELRARIAEKGYAIEDTPHGPRIAPAK